MSTDHERWERLYRESFPRVYRALALVLRDGDAALDALHDAFHEGLRNPPLSDTNLEGWLYRVALRKARRFLARAKRLRVSLGPPQPAGEDEILDRIEAERLLDLLTERQRAIVVAHYYLGLSQEEVGRLIGVRRGTVGATIAQSLKRMRVGGSEHA